jgi:hypothetical protein
MAQKEWDAQWQKWMESDFIPTNQSVMRLMEEAYQDGLSVGQSKVREFIADVLPHAPEPHKEAFIGILDALDELEEGNNGNQMGI